jgi:hypothetical protein
MDLTVKPKGKTTPGRPKRRWDDIKIDLREIGWKIVSSIQLA